jgi:subtilisin
MCSTPPDLVRHGDVIADSVLDTYKYWHLQAKDWEKIHNEGLTGKGVVIANLDTGIWDGHSDLKKPLASRSFTSGSALRDLNGHGTHCSGTNCGNDRAISPAFEADLIVGKVLSDSGSGGSNGIAAGIRWAADNGANVISMSLGGGSAYGPTRDAIQYAMEKYGTVVCAAAGNAGYNGRNTVGYPAKFPGALCIGATQANGSIAGFSSGGQELDIACPGQAIVSAKAGRSGGRTSMSGTSMATPFAAALCALIIQLLVESGATLPKSADEWRAIFKRVSEDRGREGHDPRFGHGVPVASEIVEALAYERFKFI